MSSEEGSVPPLGDDIPEEDWDAANADGATGTEEDEADAVSYDTEDEDPTPEDVSSSPHDYNVENVLGKPSTCA